MKNGLNCVKARSMKHFIVFIWGGGKLQSFPKTEVSVFLIGSMILPNLVALVKTVQMYLLEEEEHNNTAYMNDHSYS